jgi:hypothetical protein
MLKCRRLLLSCQKLTKKISYPGISDFAGKIIGQFPNTSIKALGAYCNVLRDDVSASLYLQERRLLDHSAAVTAFGKRRTVRTKLQIPRVNQQLPWLLDTLLQMQNIPKITPLSAILARHGMPVGLYTQLGGLNWLLDNDELALAGEVLGAEEPPKPKSTHFMYDFPGKFWGLMAWM